ncbi:hypothetical protein [Phenylobacterium sp. J367]|uniref:hypothetical protein n=1 Tax=Phenylobacterium sp. J367 TaxID=2898435 RepID=UPI00215154C1|nr:hypothetical protein [Phenylobacterium sp. J367]MCR5879406.1 hypothetical protein [Phenylobacterium sp. J367]
MRRKGSDQAEVNTLSDEFENESEALGYSRRMAEEMLGLADQLSLDFDYSHVALYEGELFDEDLDPLHEAFVGMWLLDDAGAAFTRAQEFRENATVEPAPAAGEPIPGSVADITDGDR